MQLEESTQLCERDQRRTDQVVETLTLLGTHGESMAEVAHDARNMVTALDLYCDLLQEPGVLAEPFAHYGGELRLVAAASRRLVDEFMSLGPLGAVLNNESAASTSAEIVGKGIEPKRRYWKNVPLEPMRNLAEELLANRNLLGSLAGPTIAVTVDVEGAAVPVRMSKMECHAQSPKSCG